MIFYFLNFAEKNPFLIDCAKKETITKRILKMRCQSHFDAARDLPHFGIFNEQCQLGGQILPQKLFKIFVFV